MNVMRRVDEPLSVRCPQCGSLIRQATTTQGRKSHDAPYEPLRVELSPCGHVIDGDAAVGLRAALRERAVSNSTSRDFTVTGLSLDTAPSVFPGAGPPMVVARFDDREEGDDYACGCAHGACDCYDGPDGPPEIVTPEP